MQSWSVTTAFLLSKFQAVEYIGRNGNNYIDTLRVPNLSNLFEIKAWVRIPTSWRRYAVLWNWWDDWSWISVKWAISTEINSWSVSNNRIRFYESWDGDWYTEDFYSSNSAYVWSFNDISWKANSTSSQTITLNWTATNWNLYYRTYRNRSAYLFVDRQKRFSELYAFDLSYLKIYEQWTLIKDFRPCYRKSDNVIWLLELVWKSFYTNKWSWTFSKWSNIPR